MSISNSLPAQRSLLAAALVLANSAWAETDREVENVEVTGEQIESYLVEEMDTATGLGLSSLETPQSVSAISRVQMDDFGLDNLNDALQGATGIQVENVETDRTYYTARGFEVTNFQVDGVGIPLSSGNLHGEIDTAIYERIEVVRGANGLMSGAGNPSATVNMLRKRPTDDFQLAVGATAGSWSSKRLDADISGTLTEGVRGRFVAAQDSGDSHLDRQSRDVTSVYGVTDLDLGESTRLTVGASYQASRTDSPMWGALTLHYTDTGKPTNYDTSSSTSADWSYWDAADTDAFVELTHRFANGWEAQAYYSHTEVDEDSELFYMYVPSGGELSAETDAGLVGYASEYDLDETSDLVDLRLSGNYQLFGREHKAMFGVNWAEITVEDLSLYDYTTGNGFPIIGDFTQWDGNTPRPTFADDPRGSDWTDEQSAIYAATRFNVFDELSFVGGVRVVSWSGKGESYGESQDTEANGEVLPYAGLVYQFGDSYSLYASHTETFMPQRDLDKNLRRLEPSEGVNDEIGVKAAWMDGKLNASFAMFDAEYQNVSESAGFDLDLGVTVYEGHDYETRGYELEVAGELAQGLQASIGYTNLDIEENGEESRTFVPKNVVRLFASYRPPVMDQLKVGGGINWQDDIERVSTYGYPIEQEAYATVRAFASYRVNENLEFSLNGNNLTDEKYISSLYWDQGFYAAPRNFTASVNWRY